MKQTAEHPHQAAVYEEALRYWPYKRSLETVLAYIVALAPRTGCLLDMMCGPGVLLDQVSRKRPDLTISGFDIDPGYVAYARDRNHDAVFHVGDVLTWKPPSKFDIVACTGALHHVPYDRQEDAIANIVSMVKSGGLAIISDCYIRNYRTELGRRLAAAELGLEYLKYTIGNGAPDSVVRYTADILRDDVLMQEFKTSLERRVPILERYFARVSTEQTWPTERRSMYGDYIHLCSVP